MVKLKAEKKAMALPLRGKGFLFKLLDSCYPGFQCAYGKVPDKCKSHLAIFSSKGFILSQV
jgi:hypothetical protein